MKGTHEAGVRALAWSNKQHGILFSGGGTDDCKLKSWNTNTKKMICERDTGSQICSIITGLNSNDVYTSHGYPGNFVQVWRAKGLKKVTKLNQHEERVLSMALSPKGDQFITASADETLCYWSSSPKIPGTVME